MGKAREQGGVTGWVPYHPAIARAIAARIPAYQQNLAPVCVLFLTVCYQMRGRSTIAGGGWFEKTRADWEETLGVSKRIVDHVINLMCLEDATGQPMANARTSLGLVRKRAGGYRNSSQYLVDVLRTNQFWLMHGPQPALTDGQIQLEAPAEVVTPTGIEVVTPTGKLVAPPTGIEVVTPTGQPHQKHIENNMENIINSANAPDGDDVLVQLLQLYGFTDKPTIKGTATRLSTMANADLVIYLTGELAHIEADRRAGTKYAIANLPGWICRQLQQVDTAAVLTWADVDQRIADAIDAARDGRKAIGSDASEQQRQARRAEFQRITGHAGESRSTREAEAEANAERILADIERRRQKKREMQQMS